MKGKNLKEKYARKLLDTFLIPGRKKKKHMKGGKNDKTRRRRVRRI